jgi:hypothetical protein
MLFNALLCGAAVCKGRRNHLEQSRKKWTQEETTFAVSGAVEFKAPHTTADMTDGKAVVRKRTLLVDMIHKRKIKMASQQSIWARRKSGAGGRSILDIGTGIDKVSSIPPYYAGIQT